MVGKAPLNPARDAFTVSSNDGGNGGAGNECGQDESGFAKTEVVLGVRDRGQRAGQEDREHHHDRKRADVEDALNAPYGELRREREFGTAGNQIRADEFASAAEKSQAGEADDGGRNHVHCSGIGADRAQKNFPAQGSKPIRDINQGDAVQHVPFADAVRLAPESSPSEGVPMAVLQVKEKGQDEEDDDGGQNTFFVHEKGKSFAPRTTRSGEAGNGTFQGK